MADDRSIPLTDSRRFHNHEIKIGYLACCNHVGEACRNFRPRSTRGKRTHIDTLRNRVHANAIPQKRPSCFPFRRINGEDGDGKVRIVHAEPADDFIHQRRLPGPTGAGNAKDRGRRMPGGKRAQFLWRFF